MSALRNKKDNSFAYRPYSRVLSSASPSFESLDNELINVDFKDLDTCLHIMSKIEGHILKFEPRLSNIINEQAKRTLRRITEHYKFREAKILLISGGLFNSLVMDTILALPVSPLRGFSELQLHCLLTGYVVTHSKDIKVFSVHNIVKFKQYPDYHISVGLHELYELGILDKLTDIDVNKLTGKFLNRTGSKKKAAYFTLSRQGNAILKDFFAVYEKIYEKIRGEQFKNDLLTTLSDLDTDI